MALPTLESLNICSSEESLQVPLFDVQPVAAYGFEYIPPEAGFFNNLPDFQSLRERKDSRLTTDEEVWDRMAARGGYDKNDRFEFVTRVMSMLPGFWNVDIGIPSNPTLYFDGEAYAYYEDTGRKWYVVITKSRMFLVSQRTGLVAAHAGCGVFCSFDQNKNCYVSSSPRNVYTIFNQSMV
ncbi:hypothetical protein DICA3_A02960 [Diutina catenulata]